MLSTSISQASQFTENIKLKKSINEYNLLAKEHKITKLIIILCFVYTIGNGPNSISPILFYLNINNSFYSVYIFLANSINSLAHASNFFIYFFFNNDFRETFFKLIKLKKV
jgi:hypothetical protein